MTVTPTNRMLIEATKAERLAKLSEFLKSCRNRTKPETFNLPVRPRRRSPGLSRAEVATLAAISVDWHTWLEQGRDVQPSPQVLDSLAIVFSLSGAERRYLYVLSNYALLLPEKLDADIQLLQRMIDGMPSAPAMLLRKDWRILGQNRCADELFGTWTHLKEEEKNLLYLFFTDRAFIEHLRDWERHARIVIRQFRAIYASELGNLSFSSLIEKLKDESPQFMSWWPEADVEARDDGRKEFDHPVLGYRDYDYTILRPAENQALEVLAFIPR